MLWIAIAIVAFAPLVAHLLGRALAGVLSAPPGRIADFMPTIPDHKVGRGRVLARFEQRRRRVERAFIRQYAETGVDAVDPQRLAATLQDDVEVVEALLAHLRESIPCRLQVTRDGRLLHTFAAADLQRL